MYSLGTQIKSVFRFPAIAAVVTNDGAVKWLCWCQRLGLSKPRLEEPPGISPRYSGPWPRSSRGGRQTLASALKKVGNFLLTFQYITIHILTFTLTLNSDMFFHVTAGAPRSSMLDQPRYEVAGVVCHPVFLHPTTFLSTMSRSTTNPLKTNLVMNILL